MLGSEREGESVPAANPERRLRVWAAIERYATDPQSGCVTLDQLCKETGASKRMLHDVCRAFSGLSVKAWIQRQRMQIARDMLVRAKPEQTTVTRVATFCGFYHLGRFSRTFRDHHGEPPSVALRRRPEA